MKTWCSVLLLVGLICLSACGMGSPHGADLSPAERLWQEKPAMVGDNTAVIHVLGHLPYPGMMGYEHVELMTDEEPYGIVGHVKGDSFAVANWKDFSVVVFAMVENADFIVWQLVNDGKDQVKVTREEVQDQVDAIANDEEAFTAFVEKMEEQYIGN